MASTQTTAEFRILDAMDGPHGGMILRLRLQEGEAPSLRAIRSSTLVAESDDGERAELTPTGFALFGGRASDARLARTGRVDVHVERKDPGQPKPGIRWTVRLD